MLAVSSKITFCNRTYAKRWFDNLQIQNVVCPLKSDPSRSMAYEPQKDIEMAAKRHKAEEIVTKLRQVDVLNAQGKSMGEAIRSIGVTEVTYYRWWSEYGGLKGDQVKRLKELEAENARLRRAVSDLALDKMILAGEADKQMVQ